MLKFIYRVVEIRTILISGLNITIIAIQHLLLREEELYVIDLLAEVSNLIHIAVKSCALFKLRSDLVIREVSVAPLSHMDLISDSLIVTVLSLEVI